MSHSLAGFTPDSFEQFVRVLALEVFGTGVTAFGNGADGGREATFDGTVPYPYPPTNVWSGYGIIQAKFKEKTETADKDQQWALQKLKDELNAFVGRRARSRKPEYYIYVTNVDLSSAEHGGIDQAKQLILDFKDQLKIKDSAIWAHSQLSAFIDKYHSVRRRFSAFLTSGDLFSALLADLHARKLNAITILTTYLDRELRADRSARLEQAGDRADTSLSLAKVFVDLPSSESSNQDAPNETNDANGRLPPGTLVELLRCASRKLDPIALRDNEHLGAAPRELIPQAFVVLGGPGSGKSTLGQYFAQLNRAALLARIEPHRLTSESRLIIDDLKKRCIHEGLPWPTTPRYPVRIELSRFAKQLASGKVSSLSAYILHDISGDFQLSHEDLMTALSQLPWLLILDGLDEVPVTSNREETLTTVANLLAEARLHECDVFQVATTRPQGYSNEFQTPFTIFRYLRPLSIARALRYSQCYADVRFGQNEPRRAQDLIDGMTAASQNPVSANLLVSPLQVTFMATVIAAQGDPGTDRWHLFKNYYGTIYARELQKALPSFQKILVSYKSLIDGAHFELGFRLQVRGETHGANGASISMFEFKQLVNERLLPNELDDADREALVEQVGDAAIDRLVFLTSRVSGELSFEVRSLQEYMASQCLMSGPDHLRRERLFAIAPTLYWRNVWLFAVGQCFGDPQCSHLCDSIKLMCEDFNLSEDPILALTKTGSDLALDVLSSGIVAQDRRSTRQLTHIALECISSIDCFRRGIENVEKRLATVYLPYLEIMYKEAVNRALDTVAPEHTVVAARIVMNLALKGTPWAVGQLKELLLMTPKVSLIYAAEWLVLSQFSPQSQVVFDNIALQLSIEDVISQLWRCNRSARRQHEAGGAKLPRSLELMHSMQRFRPAQILEDVLQSKLLSGNYITLQESFSILNACRDFLENHNLHPNWLPVRYVMCFAENPCCATLSSVFSQMHDNGSTFSTTGLLHVALPWVVSSLLSTVNSDEDLMHLARRSAIGDFGDRDAWILAEERWASCGITAADFGKSHNSETWIDRTIATHGAPYLVTSSSAVQFEWTNERIMQFMHVMVKTKAWMPYLDLRYVLFDAINDTDGLALECQPVIDVLSQMPKSCAWDCGLLCDAKIQGEKDKLHDFFDLCAASEPNLNTIWVHFIDDQVAAQYVDAWGYKFRNNTARVGLLSFLAAMAETSEIKLLGPADLGDALLNRVPLIRFYALCLALAGPLLSADFLERCLQVTRELFSDETNAWMRARLLSVCRAHIARNRSLETFLFGLREWLGSDPLSLGCEQVLCSSLEHRPSELQAHGMLAKLGLPLQ